MKLEDYDLKYVVMPLQAWFEENARELPWRSDPTPYHVWLSEIMLQQTRVEAVKDYYRRFLEKLPTIKLLSECSEDTYMKLWEGLGYYSRVRNLHTAACQIMEKYDGEFPEDEEQIRALKGVGSYTAGAISSIAFQKPVPAVDGNVLRLLMRLSADQSDIMEAATKKRVEKVLRALMEKYPADGGGEDDIRISPRVFTQALMELGALVCLPNGQPCCEKCPCRTFCQAHLQNLTGELPKKKKAKERRVEPRTILLIKDGEGIAIRKRPAKGLLAGLYELPGLEGHCDEKRVLAYVSAMGFTALHIRKLEAAKHIFSHVEWHMIGYEVKVEAKEFASSQELKTRKKEGLLLADPKEIQETYAIPTAFSAYVNQ